MSLARVLHRALGKERGDGLLLDLDGDVGRDFHAHVVVGDLVDLAEDAHGDDFVALLQRLEHRLVFLGLPHLRPDHDEVHDHEHEDDGQKAHQRVASARGWRRGLGECGTDH